MSKHATLAVALSLIVLPLPGAAQGFGGSFDGSAQGAATPPAQVAAPAQDGFGGSFDLGPAPAPAPTTAPAPATTAAAPAVGGADFAGGSFDAPAPTISPVPTAPAAQPPQVQPPAQTAPAQPPAAVRIPPEIAAYETRDFGIPPQEHLRSGQMHGPTPTAIPGGRVVSTQGLADAIEQGMALVLIDVLGGDYGLPGAHVAPGLAAGGQFRDRVQQQAATWLAQITGNDTGLPVILYCSDPRCWLSYNAALRVIAAGYGNVYWYRGGLQAWQMAGLPLRPAGF